MMKVTKEELEALYSQYNRREYVHPDPLEFLYDYPDPKDREIAGLVASSLSYGNVAQILRSVRLVLGKMTPSPHDFVINSPPRIFEEALKGFKHRWHTGRDIALMLGGVKAVLGKYGSLQSCFLAGYRKGHADILPALGFFVEEIVRGTAAAGNIFPKNLLPLPDRGSACKRLFMYLRWMIRKDEVDPGGWEGVPKSKLLVPLDTHMHRISRRMGLTKKNQANLKTALEITRKFARITPEDPVRYDFALTRLGINPKARVRLFSGSPEARQVSGLWRPKSGGSCR